VRVSLHIPVYQLVRPCWMVGGSWALLLAPRRLAWGVRTPSTMCNSCSGQEMIKGMESTGRIHTPILLLSCAHLFIFFLRFQASKFSPPITTMTSHLPRSCLHTKADHVVLRWVLGWQSPEYDDWVQCGAFLLINLQPGGELVFFSCYAATNVFLPPQSAGVLWASISSSVPHFLILVATFVHLCEMFICVPPSVTLFSLFHMP
jgi:hypothetical protein